MRTNGPGMILHDLEMALDAGIAGSACAHSDKVLVEVYRTHSMHKKQAEQLVKVCSYLIV